MADVLEVRRRLHEDYKYYAEKALKIRTKEGEIKPLIFNTPQSRLHALCQQQMAETGMVRVIILKARQQGFSTYVAGRGLFKTSQNKAQKALVMAHVAKSSTALFDMVRRYYEHLPEALKPQKKYSSRKELSFNLLDSSYVVDTAGGTGVARGETITFLHASEAAFWPASNGREIFNGLVQALPMAAGSEGYIESTANGMSGLYREMWQAAELGESQWWPFFSPWFADPSYRVTPPKSWERSYEEKGLAKEFGLDDAQLYWRRLKIAENGLELFHQEYPAYPDEAFLSTGRPVFHPDQITKALRERTPPVRRMALEGGNWEDHPAGELQLFIDKVDPYEQYVIGADVGKGIRSNVDRDAAGYMKAGTDWSVAQVLNSKKKLVASWRSQVHPDYFGHVLDRLGRHFNTARLCVENNDHGILTVFVLSRDYQYPNLYQEVVHDKVTDKETVKLGFTTNAKTRPMIIDQLRASMRAKELEIHDLATLTEMQQFVLTEAGRMEADAGCHDDCVMALALANYAHAGMYPPLVIKDDWYEEAL